MITYSNHIYCLMHGFFDLLLRQNLCVTRSFYCFLLRWIQSDRLTPWNFSSKANSSGLLGDRFRCSFGISLTPICVAIPVWIRHSVGCCSVWRTTGSQYLAAGSHTGKHAANAGCSFSIGPHAWCWCRLQELSSCSKASPGLRWRSARYCLLSSVGTGTFWYSTLRMAFELMLRHSLNYSSFGLCLRQSGKFHVLCSRQAKTWTPSICSLPAVGRSRIGCQKCSDSWFRCVQSSKGNRLPSQLHSVFGWAVRSLFSANLFSVECTQRLDS